MNQISKMRRFLALTALIVVLGSALVPPLYGGCFAWNECGAWCEAFGDCGDFEKCLNFGSGVSCQCGQITGVRTAYFCDGSVNTEYF